MYCIAGFNKVKDDLKLSQIANHNYRIHLTQAEAARIDSRRVPLNKTLINSLGVDETNGADLSCKIRGFYVENKIEVKKNSVLAIDVMLTASPEFFQDDKKNTWHVKAKIKPEFKKKIDDWVNTQLIFMEKEFGKPAIKQAILHLDETTPHIHFLVTPEETKEVKFKNRHGSGSKVITSLNADRWNPAFWGKFLKNYEKANAKYGLKKGEEGSLSENVDLKTFMKTVTAASQADYSKTIERIVHGVEHNLSVLNTKEGVKKLLMEQLLPALNPTLKQNKALKRLLALDRAKEYKAIKKMREDLEAALEDARARRTLYIEAINEKAQDAKLLIELQRENDALKAETNRLKVRYESDAAANQPIKAKKPTGLPGKPPF